MKSNLVFHHIGIACRDIAEEMGAWKVLGYQLEGEQFEDPAQGIEGIFMTGAGPRLELLHSMPGRITLKPWIERGIKMYHQAFLTADIHASIVELEEERARVVVEPTPAVAFAGRPIAFLMLPNLSLIE